MFFLFRLQNLLYRVYFRLVVGPFFGRFGRRAVVLRPRGIEGIGNIRIGDDVYVADGGLLAAVPLTGADSCTLTLGAGCKLGANNQIYATRSIIFENDVLTAANVYVSDNAHGYEDTSVPILKQPIRQLAEVRIGAGSWLGHNVCVQGASIGKGCVIGANAVVLQDIPDFCVAVGAPARVVRRVDPQSGRWARVPAQGLGGGAGWA
jgi:acetyltransferase-like isoleucine patch superfamily enzyme